MYFITIDGIGRASNEANRASDYANRASDIFYRGGMASGGAEKSEKWLNGPQIDLGSF